MTDEVAIAVARLETKVDMMLEQQQQLAQKLDTQDVRLRSVETKGAVYGAVGGSIVSIGISLLVAGLKSKTGVS